jgi:hypothetical protein
MALSAPFADLRIRDYLTAIRVALECSGSPDVRRKPVSGTVTPNEKALLVWCWQAMQWHV